MVPPLVDLCLFCVCRSRPGSEYLHLLPDYVRQRLFYLLKQEPTFQQSLVQLNFSHCGTLVDEEVKCMMNLPNLTYLNLSHCDKLTGYSLAYVGHLYNLKTLHLNHCPKMSMGLYFLQNLKQVSVLEVAFCEIQDPVMPFITNLPNLTYLNLMCNRLTDEGCVHLATATNLTRLNLSMNPLITDKTLEPLSRLSKLVSLNLNYCKLLTSNGISSLSKALPALKQLEIIGCDRAMTEAKTRPLILLAEDSKVQARMISLVLNRYNFDVEIATDGEMALEMFRANPRYDLILMDVLMPVMDGISCIRQIREYEALHGLKPTPIIVQSADTRESQRVVSLEAGATEFLSKPIDKTCVSLAKELMEASNK